MDATVLKVIRIALSIFTDKLITFLALAMSFGLACWVMYGPTIERLIMAGFFAVMVFLPALIKEHKREDKHNDD